MPTGKYSLSEIDKPETVHTGISAEPQALPPERTGVSQPPGGEGEAVTTGPYSLNDIDQPPGAPQSPPKEERFSTQLIKGIPSGIKEAGIGALKGAGGTANNIGNLLFGDYGYKAGEAEEGRKTIERILTPSNSIQGFGKAAEQAGEFLIPGGMEEHLAGLAPEAIRPIARIGASALGSGVVNKAQGGEFGTGAAAGAIGSGIGQGLKAAAPAIAEKALGIRGKFDRAFNKSPGLAALEETGNAIRPETIAKRAGERIGQLSGETEELANRASVRPNPVRGLLSGPNSEIPLAPAPSPRNPRMRPMAFPAEINPEEPMEPRSGNPLAPISEYPGINPHFLSGSEHPELSGRIPTTQGVLIRPAPVGEGPIPSTLPNRMASLAPARNALEDAMRTAERQNAAGTHAQIGGMRETLGRRFGTGEAIPENVTPRELLDLRRGFNEEHGRWNPDIHEPAVAASRRAYGGLTGEFHRVLPEAESRDLRISNLIPVKNRAQITALGDNPLQKGLARFGAHTGALTLGGIGAYQGGREGGIKGAVAGGLTGVLAPELIASPEGQMALARSLYRARELRPLTGAALQFDRNKEPQK